MSPLRKPREGHRNQSVTLKAPQQCAASPHLAPLSPPSQAVNRACDRANLVEPSTSRPRAQTDGALLPSSVPAAQPCSDTGPRVARAGARRRQSCRRRGGESRRTAATPSHCVRITARTPSSASAAGLSATRCPPIERLAQERERLHPLPAEPFTAAFGVTRGVGDNMARPGKIRRLDEMRSMQAGFGS